MDDFNIEEFAELGVHICNDYDSSQACRLSFVFMGVFIPGSNINIKKLKENINA